MHNLKVKLTEIHCSLFGFLVSAWSTAIFDKRDDLVDLLTFFICDIFGLEIPLLLDACYRNSTTGYLL